MADPITWGLLNLIKKRVKGVQTTLDGVSDKVSSLPDSLDADFTEVKEAIADVKVDVGNVNTAVGGVKEDTTSIKNTVDTNPLLKAGTVIKSIQRGIKQNNAQTFPLNISISPVNVEKSILVANFEAGDTGSFSGQNCQFTISLSSNKITVKDTDGIGFEYAFGISWQVIEFY